MILYKYVSSEVGLQTLKTGLIRFTQPISFNDPFEATPIIESVFTPEQMSVLIDVASADEAFVEQQMERTLAKVYFDTDPAKRGGFTLEQCVKIGKGVLKNHIAKNNIHLPTYLKQAMLANFASLQNKAAAEVIHKLKTEICILCLSAVNNHEVLWAKYADESFGIVLGFDTSHSFFAGMQKVQYTDDRPKVSLPDATIGQEAAQRIAVDIISTKSCKWSYEEEYRLLRAEAQADSVAGNDRMKYPICLYQYPVGSVVEVIAGSRANDETLHAIREVVQQEKFSHVRVGHVELSKDQYELLVVWYQAAA